MESIELRSNIEAYFIQVYNEIGFIKIKHRSSSAANDSVDLLEIFVPLKADLNLDFIVNQSKVKSVSIKSDATVFCELSDTTVVNKNNKLINYDFVENLLGALQDIIDNPAVKKYGIRLNHRPVLFSTLWSDGEKHNAAVFEVLSALHVFNRVVLLGSPGSGKSTILKALACCLLKKLVDLKTNSLLPEEVDSWTNNKPIPIYIEIKDIVFEFPPEEEELRAGFFSTYIKQKITQSAGVEVATYVVDQLNKGNAVLLFDGLDEMTVTSNTLEHWEKRRIQIKNFFVSLDKQYPLCRIIVTSRPAGYSGWSLTNFITLQILPIDVEESKGIIGALLKLNAITDENLTIKINELSAHLNKIPAALKYQPLFVVLLTLLYIDSPEKKLPSSKAELLEHSINLLLEAWSNKIDKSRSIYEIMGCSQKDILTALQKIAYKSLDLEVNKTSDHDETYIGLGLILEELFLLNPEIKQGEVLSYISNRAGILISPSIKKYKFVHRLFAEYLASVNLSNEKGYGEKLILLLDKSFFTWKEVALLISDHLQIAGRENDIWNLLELLAEKKLPKYNWLISKIIADINLDAPSRIGSKAIAAHIKKSFIEVGNAGLEIEEIADLAIALNILGDERKGIGNSDQNLPEFRWCDISCENTIIGLSDDLKNKLTEMNHSNWNFKREVPSFRANLKFKISYYPVTVKQFNSFLLDKDGYQSEQWWTAAGLQWKSKHLTRYPVYGRDNFPQNMVNWYEANAFCKWVSKKSNEHISLPTEIQWEAAAKSCQDVLFPWGNEFHSKHTNTLEGRYKKIMPVGSFNLILEPTGNLPFDLIGNIWEWCSSIVEKINGPVYSYPWLNDERENENLGDEYMRATRGGYFNSALLRSRSSFRGRDIPNIQVERQGFRVIKNNSF